MPATWWEWTAAVVLVICGIILAVAVSQQSVADGVLVGLAALGGVARVYQDTTSTSERRLQHLGWLAFVQVVFVALAGI